MKSWYAITALSLILATSCGKKDSTTDVDTDDTTETAAPTPTPCADIDCGPHGRCEELDGQATCDCDEGYVAESLQCVDLDECATDNGGCGSDIRFLCENQEAQAPICTDKCADLGAHIEENPNAANFPPMAGTVWYSTEIIIESDPSSFVDLSYAGQGERVMFDRRTASWITENAHLFPADFGGGVEVEIQVNPEFSREEAEVEARFYAKSIGKIPAFLFRDIQTVWIHRGVELYGGGNNNLLIHTGQTPEYVRDGVLEEVFIHEAAHTSMDAYHAAATEWLAAQAADGIAISDYAQEHPNREDIAETLGPYLAYRHRRDRLNNRQIKMVKNNIPNRVLFFECLELGMDLLE